MNRRASTLALLAAALIAAPARGVEPRRLAEGWEFHQGSLGSTWEVWRGDRASDNVAWAPVTVPHCFNARDAVDPDVRYYQGPGWYRTRLAAGPPEPGERLLLRFDGAGQTTRVFVGLDEVAEHVGGYDEWTVDITDAVAREASLPGNDGTARLAVRCDNSRDAETIPSDLSDFNRYGGLYRHVTLLRVPAVSLEQAHVLPRHDAGGWMITLRARLHNPLRRAEDLPVAVEVRDPAGAVVHAAAATLPAWSGDRPIAEVAIPAARLWSPRSPHLYECRVTLGAGRDAHTLVRRFGLRTAEWVEHGPFRLNGERLLLRGTHYHEDHAGVAAAVPDDVVRRTLRQIKDVGANFVRLGHYQQAPLVLDLCDELGLLVWEEIPWCRGGLGGDRYRRQCRDMLRSLIDQHFNHPSVILWGLGNENDWPGDFADFDKAGIRGFMTELNALAHELDPSRQTAIRRCDFCKDIVDVYAPSIWAGWYSGRYTEYRAAMEAAIADVPHVFHAEWGGDSHAGRFSEDPERMLAKVAVGEGTAEKGKAYKSSGGKVRMSKDGDWSESYMVNLFDWHLHEQERMENLTGSAAWIFKDFATPLRPENPVPRVNQKGIVTRDGTPKESYYVFQSYWADEPMVHVLGHGWHRRWGRPDEKKEVRVYSNCAEVELFLNGDSVGSRKRDVASYPAAGLRWEVSFRPGPNVVRAVAGAAGGRLADEVAFEYVTGDWGRPAKLALAEADRDGESILLEARVTDAAGVECLDAADVVRFGMVGEGRLVDNLGTPAGSRVVQLANGRARIRVELTGRKAVAAVTGSGLRSAFCTLESAPKPAAAAAAPGPGTVAGPVALVATIDRDRILRAADAALALAPVTITATRAALSEGGANDFYSNGDYWWPDPTKPGGLPYIRRDGETNPGNFTAHRRALKDLRDRVAALAAAHRIGRSKRHADKADELLRVFFLDPASRMHPHLAHAQAVPGVSPGRPAGIIDGLHLIEVAAAVKWLAQAGAIPDATAGGVKRWFADLCQWMRTSTNGREEAAAKNNHAVAYFVQLAAFADLTGDEEILAECRRQFREVFVPRQMAADGSFPLELRRTKPYGYSIFQLDQMATLCQILSRPGDDLWSFTLPDGRGMRRAMDYLSPFLADKGAWPLPPDVEHWQGWPTRQPSLLFAGIAYDDPRLLGLWRRLPADPEDEEVQRNVPITQPILWLD